MGTEPKTMERIKAVKAAFSILGYDVTSDPIAGAEESYLAEIEQVYTKTENFYTQLCRRRRYTLFGALSLETLHKQFPEPAWGIEVRHASEKEALKEKIARFKNDLEQAAEERNAAQRRMDEALISLNKAVAQQALLELATGR